MHRELGVRRLFLLGCVAGAAMLCLVGCSSSGDDSATATTNTTANATTTTAPRSPRGVIAIGHSGLTGLSSAPDRPGRDARENSWATGTASEVRSVYQRLVAARPENEGHVANVASDGAPASELTAQAREALAEVPAPLLAVIQTIDNDIQCDGTDEANIEAFGSSVAEALGVIARASPMSRILVVSNLGRPATFAAALASRPDAVSGLSGDGMCDLFDSTGQVSEEHLATLTTIIEGYEAELTRVCATVAQCRDDGGALATFVDEIGDYSGDWQHLSVEGHARVAATIWPAVAMLLQLS